LFAHSINELQDGPDLYKTQLCADFINGGCDNPDCTFAHGHQELQPFPTLKQKLCKWHRKGKCRNGESCSFAHGRQDIREASDEFEDDSPTVPASDVPAMELGGQLSSKVTLTPFLNLQAALPETTTSCVTFPVQPQAVMYCWWKPTRTPLHSKVAPFVPASACEAAPPLRQEHLVDLDAAYNVASSDDTKSTCAETAGYLSD